MNLQTLEELRAELHKNSGVGFLLPIAEHIYRAHEAISQSEIKLMAKATPKHLQYQRRFPRPSSDAQKLGTAAHLAILQPLLFEDNYLKAKKSDKRTKEGRSEWAEVKAQAEKLGKKILDEKEYSSALEMRQSVRSDPEMNRLLEHGVAERACFGYLHGLSVKALLDFYKPKTHEIVDIKSTKCAEPSVFEKDVRKYRYHWQACWYSDLIKEITGEAPTFKILAIESHPPFCSAIYEIDFDLMSIARKEIMEKIDIYKRCLDSGVWPGYSNAVQKISANKWEWDKFKDGIKDGAA